MKNIWRSAVAAWKEAFSWENAIAAVLLTVVAGLVSYITGWDQNLVITSIVIALAFLVVVYGVLLVLIRKLRQRPYFRSTGGSKRDKRKAESEC